MLRIHRAMSLLLHRVQDICDEEFPTRGLGIPDCSGVVLLQKNHHKLHQRCKQVNPGWENAHLLRMHLTSPEPGRISDSEAVVKSILSGRRLARAIHQHYNGEGIIPLSNLAVEAEKVLNVYEISGVNPAQRETALKPTPEAGTENDWCTMEEIPGLSEAAARKEANRCLSCGLICYRNAV